MNFHKFNNACKMMFHIFSYTKKIYSYIFAFFWWILHKAKRRKLEFYWFSNYQIRLSSILWVSMVFGTIFRFVWWNFKYSARDKWIFFSLTVLWAFLWIFLHILCSVSLVFLVYWSEFNINSMIRKTKLLWIDVKKYFIVRKTERFASVVQKTQQFLSRGR